MCGRYSTAKIPKKKFEEKLKVKLEDYSPSFNACPGMPHPVIAFKGDKTKTSNMIWGLIPQWSKVHNPKIKPINARSETLSQKPTFKNLINRKDVLSRRQDTTNGNLAEKRKFHTLFMPQIIVL